MGLLDSTHYHRQTALLYCDRCCKSSLGYSDPEHTSDHSMEDPPVVEKEDLNCCSFHAWGLVGFPIPPLLHEKTLSNAVKLVLQRVHCKYCENHVPSHHQNERLDV